MDKPEYVKIMNYDILDKKDENCLMLHDFPHQIVHSWFENPNMEL